MTQRPARRTLGAMTESNLDLQAFRQLLSEQDGLFSAGQASNVGMTRSALSRRAASGAVRQGLPRVYVQGGRELDDRQRCRAAVLYAGSTSCLTGEAALLWRRIEHLPREVTAERVDVLIPSSRSVASREWVRITRTRELPWSISVDGVPTARPTRAVIDAALRLSSYETVLATVSAVVNA